METLATVLDVVLWTLLIPLVFFVYKYAKDSRWWVAPIGRIIMLQNTSWIVYIITVIIAKAYREEYWFHFLRAGVYSLLVISFWAMLWQLIVAQRVTMDARKASKAISKRRARKLRALIKSAKH